MTYQYDWHPDAFDTMQAIIRAHPNHKDYLAGILRTLSAALGNGPGEAGESREDNDRVIFVGPFVVWFRVLHADRRVLILRVHLGALLL